MSNEEEWRKYNITTRDPPTPKHQRGVLRVPVRRPKQSDELQTDGANFGAEDIGTHCSGDMFT